MTTITDNQIKDRFNKWQINRLGQNKPATLESEVQDVLWLLEKAESKLDSITCRIRTEQSMSPDGDEWWTHTLGIKRDLQKHRKTLADFYDAWTGEHSDAN